MTYIVGKDWRELFDVVIVQADKPGFFNDRRKWVCDRLSCSTALPPLGVALTAVNSSGTGGDVGLEMTSPTS